SRGSQSAALALEFRMSPALSKSLIDILLASGVPSRDEAVALAANLNGSSWTAEVLNSGKVDEQLFLKAIGDFLRVAGVLARRQEHGARDTARPAEPVRLPAPYLADRDQGECRRPRDLRS